MKSPAIQHIKNTIVVGISTRTTYANHQAPKVWGQFMPRLSEVRNRNSDDLIALHVYDQLFSPEDFSPQTPFTTWACASVSHLENQPAAMETITIPEGLYAVFIHKGPAASFPKTANYIYNAWLPSSGYQLDDRPHFEKLPKDYPGPNDPAAEETVWIPIKK